MLKIVQIGMNSSDMAGSLRLFSEVFGFINAGGQALWGPPIRVQALQDGDRAIIWWLLGRERGVQLELFHHSRPQQRPLRPDWRPNDLGWVRFGAAVADFDAALRALESNGIAPLAAPVTRDGLRRVSFREPYIGCIVEIFEDGPAVFWTVAGDARLPALIYATSSVSDIASARRHYEQVLGMRIEPIDRLHQPGDEACWGLGGAERQGFLAHLGGVRLEIVDYRSPRGRPKPGDYRTSDQGIVNVGLRAGTCAEAVATFDRLAAAGLVSPHRSDGGGLVSGYITDFEREIEIVALPDALNAVIGFEPKDPFIVAMG
jgi:catechol 2,3-dioxygenase-like lactoylglutathione lyase family enzyme